MQYQDDHFWTTDPNGEALYKATWTAEGPACKVLSRPDAHPGAVPFHRFVCTHFGPHFWTTDPNGELLPKPEYKHEEIACYVFKTQAPGTIPLYRWAGDGLHFWTTDPNGELLPKPLYHSEGPACFVFPAAFPDQADVIPFYRWRREVPQGPNVRTKHIDPGDWRTLETTINLKCIAWFREPPGARIKVSKWLFSTDEQQLDGINYKTIVTSLGKIQIIYPHPFNVTYLWYPLAGGPTVSLPPIHF